MAATLPIPDAPRVRRMACGMGAMKLIWARGTRATIEAVPRINMAQMMGEEISTDRPMARAGSRLSPARMAMYSSPQRAPKSIWPKRARVRRSRGGRAMENGV